MNENESRRNTSNVPDDDREAGRRDAGRREPVFSDFDEDEAFEESERDTDFASAYEDELEDELEDDDNDYDYEPDEEEDDSELETEWQPMPPAQTRPPEKSAASRGNPWDLPTDDGASADTDAAPANDRTAETSDTEADEYDDEEEWDEEEYETEADQQYADDSGHGWPVGLIVVAVVALVLLAAGGYGVIQQRAATQEEIRQLQAALATAASPAEVSASRQAMRELEETNARQLATVEALTLENRRLLDMVAGLENKLATQQPAAAKPAEPAAPPRVAAKPKVTEPAAKAATGDWFVNFSSYGQRSAAEAWVKKLKPAAGKAVVQPGSRDGKTFYRVRIIGLADRAQAERVASQLQTAYGLPKLWVGTE